MIAQTIEITFTNSNLHAYSHFVCIKQCRQCHNDIACEYTLKIYIFTRTVLIKTKFVEPIKVLNT